MEEAGKEVKGERARVRVACFPKRLHEVLEHE